MMQCNTPTTDDTFHSAPTPADKCMSETPMDSIPTNGCGLDFESGLVLSSNFYM